MESEQLSLYFEKENQEIPWGFRLIGGVDYNEPLTVIKVCEGSVAENVGMRVGDVLVRINDINASDLTHAEAHDVILSGKCNFTITVTRGEKTEVEITAEEVKDVEKEESSIKDVRQSDEATIQKESDLNITDEEIVQIIQGEQQQQQNDEISSVIISSELLQAVKEEDVEFLEVKHDSRKWSTFLQKPDKPMRKSKVKEEQKEKQGSGYQVVIKKQKRKSFEAAIALLQDEDKLLTVDGEEIVTNLSNNPTKRNEENDDEIEESLTKQKPIDDPDETAEERNIDVQHQSEVEENIATHENPGNSTEDCPEIEDISKKLSGKRRHKNPKQGGETIEEQLAEVQEQLLALSRLPSTIQSTLNAVTRQLEKIATAAQLVEGNDEDEEDVEEEHSYEATTTTEDEITEQNTTSGMLSTVIEDPNEEVKEGATDDEEHTEKGSKENVDTDGTTTISEGAIATEEVDNEEKDEFDDGLTVEEREQIRKEHEFEENKKKDVQVLQVLEETSHRRIEDRSKMPLTPLERPIILPGGRKWCEPEDVLPKPRHRKMSDDTINHTIETYSEVLVGRLKGESNCHMVPSKVLQKGNINFLKYQPPPKNLDHLQRSAVYKMIHEMEPPPKGISTRTEKILAAEDYLKMQQEGS